MRISIKTALFHSVPYTLLIGAFTAVRLEVASSDNARVVACLCMIVASVMILMQASQIGRHRPGRR
jgi:hypothetical protein